MDSEQQPKVEVEEQNIKPSKSEETVSVVSDDPGEFSDVEMEQSEEKEVKKPPQQGKENSVSNSIPNGSHEKVNKTHESNVKVEVNNVVQNQTNNVSNGHSTTNHYIPAIKAQNHLPRPEPPPQRMERSQSLSIAESMPSIGKYIRDRSSTFSAALVKRLSSFREDAGDFVVKNDSLNFEVTEFKIPGVKVIVKLKNEDEITQLIGRVTFFTKSNCRDSTAVRKFLREKGMRYVEINVDVFPKRAKELVELTGSSEVPQIFFNEKLLGGLVTLNSLRNSGELDKRMKEMLSTKCPDNAPAIPVYGFDDEENEQEDELVGVVKAMRQCLPIEDRFIKMKIAKNCFAGDDLVEAIIHHLDCGRKKGDKKANKGIATAKLMAQKHFIHHVFGENDFELGKHYYRFLEHEPFILGCFNFRNSTNDAEPKSASFVADRLMRLMTAILEAYASEDRLHLNYYAISKSEEFRRYLNLSRDLQRINLQLLTPDERLAFFLNLHNAMVIHAAISIGHPEGILDKRAFFSDFQYVVGGHPYSLNTIENGILRINRKSPYSLLRPFSNGDRRLELAPTRLNPLIHFGLCNGTRSAPAVRFFTPQGVEAELRTATREYFQRGGIEINLDKRTVHLTRIIKWFSVDFGEEKEVLKWVLNYLDATKQGLLTHLLDDGGSVNIVYQNYDWSGNF
ncbi:hypothetical protein CCACVL1_07827 [Corchorus capsularis]|uniref:DEP domain-containing protein n=1 Tax=Corchorus capsularis TaxID=210143 RepID=A0A1R3J3M8_COCAP|nr:hypothetical protein CCACVL1_07827 [Corchorus capsularis]